MNGMCSAGVAGVMMMVVAGSASGFEFRSRFVKRVGNVDTPISDSSPFIIHPLEPARVRIQFGVFDDANGPAPEGGLIGWNVGTISVSGPSAISDVSRTPGRLMPFNFATGPNANGNPRAPAGDPFLALTEIDCTLGTQAPIWTGCDANGNPAPQPPPVIRGLNTFVSVYEITVIGFTQYDFFSISFGGNLIGALNWTEVGTPNPPNCDDPENPEPGSVTYAPFPTTPVAHSRQFSVLVLDVPGPGAAAPVVGGLTLLCRRRRAR